MQQIINSALLTDDLNRLLSELPHDKLFILTDEHTAQHCLPTLRQVEAVRRAAHFSIRSGDANKNVEALASVWQFLSENGATRHSLLINLGGGMLTDLGGFAAASFKRGIRFINVPTTLLGAVDAAVGGKTGINFLHFKNEIGAFALAKAVLIHADFFRTLSRTELLSGYAELLKHALIDSDAEWRDVVGFDLEDIDYARLQTLLFRSVKVKERIVEEDPFEHGIRKALNLGHTIGHAFEGLAMELNTPIPHGFAVAWGIVCELYLSSKQVGFPKDKLLATTTFVRENWGECPVSCNHYDRLFDFMRHDKKNLSADNVNFTFIKDVGEVCINQSASQEAIFEAIDFMRESCGG